MQLLRRIIIVFLVIVLSILSGGIANAIPTAAFNYVETDLGDGSWQYDYTLFNTSDPGTYAGFDIYYVFFGFDRSYALTIKSVPDGWTSNSGSGFGNAWSTKPGLPPDGGDIAPGMSLSGFIFQFNEQEGDILFEALFVNPNHPDYPARFSGTTAPVPEPATILLLVAGMVGMGVFGRKKFRN